MRGNDILNSINGKRKTNSNGNWYSKTNTKIDTRKWTNDDVSNVSLPNVHKQVHE